MPRSAKACIRTLILSVLVFTSNAFAATCYERSPNLDSLGDEYYNLDEPMTLSNVQQDQVKTLFRQLRDKWRGAGTHMECLGPDDAPEEKVFATQLWAKTESNNPLHIAFNTKIKNLDNGVSYTERTDLLGNTPVFSFESISTNHIVFAEKYRSATGVVKKNKTRFTRLVENIYDISLNNDKFHFIKLYYINGIYVAKDEWHLYPAL